jgi:hypothetical protein
VLGTSRIHELAARIPGATPHAPAGGATILSPLPAQGGPRRTVHLEFAASELPGATRFREHVR